MGESSELQENEKLAKIPIEQTGLITKESIYQIFEPNWAFKLFSWDALPYGLLAVLVALVPLLICGFLSIFWRVTYLYFTNGTVYLNTFGFSLSLISFGWFTRILPESLAILREAFELDDDGYKAIITKWAKLIANRNWIMVLIAIIFAVPNILEVRSYWISGSPPMLLEPWVSSHASGFFAFCYGVFHALVTPFLLGSGLVGLVGFLLLFNDVFKQKIKLPYYRRTKIVVDTTAWLVMWALIALAAVLVFSRPLVVFSTNSQAVFLSGMIQSVLATMITLLIGLLPIFFVSSCISRSKKSELYRLEKCEEVTYSVLINVLEDLDHQYEHGEKLDKVKFLTEELSIIKEQTSRIENIPNLPIRFFSVTRISLSALLSISSPFIQEWVLKNLPLP